MWSNGEENEIEYGYDSGFSAGQPFEWDSPPPYGVQMVSESCLYGLQASKQEYDYGSGSPGSLLRTTSTTYQYQNSANYLTVNLLNLPASVQVTGIGPGSYTTYGYDETGCSSGLCGNQTSVHDWLNTTGGYLVTTNTYDPNGRLIKTYDPKNNWTTYGYSSSTCPNSWNGTYAGTGPTCVTNALSQTTYFNYDLNTGSQTSVTDPNNRPTYTSYDDMLRTTEIDYPDGGQTTFSYPGATEVQIGEKIDTNGNEKTWNLFVDGLGRLSQTQLTSDPDGTDYTLTTYDAMGRKHQVYNPTRCSAITTNCGESTWGYTTYYYDALSRPTSVTEQDGSTVGTNYASFPCVTITDEASKTRESCTDGLGRLTTVVENPGGLNYTTSYNYDALDNLTGVTQVGSRQRSFTYDSLSRLTSAYNPESGTTSYAYDADGNVITKTDARGIVTCYGNWSGSCDGTGWDPLNRVSRKTYSDTTPTANYYYDNGVGGYPSTNTIGRLTASNDGIAEFMTYDPMGRLNTLWQCVPNYCTSSVGPTYTVATYDLLGDIASLAYPDGRVVKTSYVTGGKTAARPIQVTFDNFNGTSVNYNYLSAAHYTPDGSPASTLLGNGVSETSTYNDRLQPCNQQIATGASPWVNRTYSFYSNPTCTGTSGNNGNVMQIADNLHNGRTQNFSYDPLNRLATAATQATSGPDCWGNSFGYDQWGNLLQQNVTQCSAPYMNLSVNANNQITNSGFAYDAAGNLTLNSPNTYQYDAEDRLTNYNSGAGIYTYDAEGNRVQKQAGGVTTDYIYFGGQPIAEYNPATGDWSDYIYAGARRLARDDTFSNEMDIGGTNSTNTQATVFALANAGGLSGYTIQSGDKLSVFQYEWSGTEAGIGLTFTDNTNSNWTVTDQFGDYMNQQTSTGTEEVRTFDLSAFAGKQVNGFLLDDEIGTAAEPWGAAFQQISLVSTDGTVHSVYNDNPSYGISFSWTSGATGITWGTNTFHNRYSWEALTANYYHGDQLGSSRLMTDGSGWPVWSATFLPFGEEWNPQATVNHYKFTGKERDDESGLDNFGARYLTSTYGRFMSPDPLGGKRIDPQTLNKYSYVRNNPPTLTDPTGLYTVDCSEGDAKDQKKCTKASSDFEKQRLKDLESKHQSVREAAAAWGTPTDKNGITVTFKPQAKVDADAGNTDPNTRVGAIVGPIPNDNHTPEISAEFSESLGGSDLQQAIAHEGSHVEDDMGFLNSYDPLFGVYNSDANFTHFSTEMSAYDVGAQVEPYSFFREGDTTDKLRKFLYSNPIYKTEMDRPVFDPSVYPQAQLPY